MTYLKTIALLIAALISGQAVAQKQPLDTVRAKLAFLVGSYTTATTVPKGEGAPNGATGTGTSVITWALDSMFLAIDDESMNTLFGKYKGHGMLGYEPATSQYVLSMFNNFGDIIPYRGDFAGDTLVMQARVQMPGYPFDQKLLWYKDGETVKLKVFNDIGKGFVLVIDQTAVRRSGQ